MKPKRVRRNKRLVTLPSRNSGKHKRERIRHLKGGSLPEINDGILKVIGRRKTIQSFSWMLFQK